MSDKPYSEVIELNFTEIVNHSLLPSTVLTHTGSTAIKYFGRYYWPLWDRMDKKGVAFEPHKWSVSILGKPTPFPRSRNLLFVAKLFTAKNKTSLVINTEIFDPVKPFDLVAQCSIETREAKIASDWIGEHEDASKPIRSDISDLTDNLNENIPLIDNLKLMEHLDRKGRWIGPVETKHVCLPEYCEFVALGTMAKITGLITSSGKWALIKWAQKNNVNEPQLEALRKKTNYLNWNVWAERKNTFWLYDEIMVKSYCMVLDDKVYLKHLTYMVSPKVLTNTFIEEYYLS